MKKLFFFLSLPGLLLTLVHCDYVKNANDHTSPVGIDSTVVYRKVLVEDYTGHKCGNCPAAARELAQLEKTYGKKIVPLAIHAGYFAKTNAQYPTNFQNPAGDAYDATFGNSAAGNPNGLINRTGFGTPGFIRQYSSWGAEIAQLSAQLAKLDVRINTSYSGNKLSATVEVKTLVPLTGNYRLVVLLAEDSIVAEQLDYSLPSGSQFVPNYLFMHVLREAINSTWGDTLFTAGASIPALSSTTKTYSNYTLNAGYAAEHCHVIAYVYDADPNSPTYYEILQVEEKHLK